MRKLKFEYKVEFTLPGGKKMRTTVQANDHDEAINELFKAVRGKTIIHLVEKPNNDHNTIVGLGHELMDIFDPEK